MPDGPTERIVLDYATPRRRSIIRWRFSAWIACVLTLVLMLPVLLLAATHGNLSGFISTWPLLGGIVVVVAILLATTPPDAIRLSPATSTTIILAVTLLLHVAGIGLYYPSLSEDMLRYRVDGRMITTRVSPWSKTPNEWIETQPRNPRSIQQLFLDALTPFREYRSIYPPVAECFFGVVDWIAVDLFHDVPNTAATVIWADPNGTQSGSAHALLFRTFAAVFALGCTAAMLGALSQLGRSLWYAALFAWNPLTVIESSGQGHVDILGVLFVLIALLFVLREHLVLAAIALAIAAGVKPHVALLAPVIALVTMRSRSRCHPAGIPEGSMSLADQARFFASTLRMTSRTDWSSGAKVTCAFAVTLLIVYAPLIFIPANFRGWYGTVQVYSASWEANGSVYELLTAAFRHGDGRSLENAKTLARLLGGVGTFLTLYLCIRKRLPLADSAYWLFLSPLLLAPVVYPWYLLWGLAMVPLLQRTGGWTMLVWAATSGLSYQLLREPTWHLPAAWAMAEYLPVFVALAAELWGLVRTRDTKSE